MEKTIKIGNREIAVLTADKIGWGRWLYLEKKQKKIQELEKDKTAGLAVFSEAFDLLKCIVPEVTEEDVFDVPPQGVLDLIADAFKLATSVIDDGPEDGSKKKKVK